MLIVLYVVVVVAGWVIFRVATGSVEDLKLDADADTDSDGKESEE